MTYEQALGRMAALCSTAEHCESEIREKLQRAALPETDIQRIVDYLYDEQYMDTARYCRAFAHDRLRFAHWGRVKIRQMLRHLHLSEDEIAEGMSAIPEDDYLQAISDALRAKDRTLRDTGPYQRKGKLVRHLLSRGFEMELVLDAVDEYLKLE